MTNFDRGLVAFGIFLIGMHVLLAMEEWPETASHEIVGKHYTWRAH
jgi:hypothetical protein